MVEELNIETEFARPGSTHYMDAPALTHGTAMPATAKLIVAALGLLALFVASFFGLRAYDAVANAPTRYAESIEEALHVGAGLELPLLNSYVGSDNSSIREALASSGYTTIDVDALYASNEEVDANSIDLVKIPHEMDYDIALDLFQNSLRRASITDAIQYLAGSWRFTSYAAEGIDLKVKYADFQSSSIEEAIASAIANQGWSDSTFGETGVDQSGNTFQNGTIQLNDYNMNWSVSVCPLDEVYNVSGLPDNSYYVGVRLVQ